MPPRPVVSGTAVHSRPAHPACVLAFTLPTCQPCWGRGVCGDQWPGTCPWSPGASRRPCVLSSETASLPRTIWPSSSWGLPPAHSPECSWFVAVPTASIRAAPGRGVVCAESRPSAGVLTEGSSGLLTCCLPRAPSFILAAAVGCGVSSQCRSPQPAVLSGAPHGARERGVRAAGPVDEVGASGERAPAGAARQGGAQAKRVDTVQ